MRPFMYALGYTVARHPWLSLILLLTLLASAGCAGYARNMSALKANEAAGILLTQCRAGDNQACALVMQAGGGNVGTGIIVRQTQ